MLTAGLDPIASSAVLQSCIQFSFASKDWFASAEALATCAIRYARVSSVDPRLAAKLGNVWYLLCHMGTLHSDLLA